jgi:hypothetical protein
MPTAVSGVPPVITRPTILERLKIPPQLAWGYLGLLLFMIGDGIDVGYLSVSYCLPRNRISDVI